MRVWKMWEEAKDFEREVIDYQRVLRSFEKDTYGKSKRMTSEQSSTTLITKELLKEWECND